MRKVIHIKHFVRSVIILILVCYFGLIAIFNLSFVQKQISDLAAEELSKLMKTEVSIGNIDLGLLNRVIIQNVTLKDRGKRGACLKSHVFRPKWKYHLCCMGKSVSAVCNFSD